MRRRALLGLEPFDFSQGSSRDACPYRWYGELSHSFAAMGRLVRSHWRIKRWARVSPGASASWFRSEGLSISRAIPGSEITAQGLSVARAAARCGLKLS